MNRLGTLTTAAGRELARFRAAEGGATSVEYAMVASGIAVAVAALIFALGSKVNTLFTTLSNLMS